MSTFKKALALLLVIAITAAIAVTGTLAYLQSEDSDVNVMTLGNVKIKQHEYERVVDTSGAYTTIKVDGTDSYELQEFTQLKPLYPFVGEVNNGYDKTEVRLAQLGHNSRGGMQVFPAANVQDKFVVVENTGKSDAYVRTIVAFEAGSLTPTEWKTVVNYSFHFTWKEPQKDTGNWFVTDIDGNNYYLVEFIYNGYENIQHPNGVLKPGDYTYNSLAQVYMYDTATNEDMEKIDGNKNGTFDILVVSQAVQADGFSNAETALDAAFGDITTTNHPWVGEGNEPVIPTVASTQEELAEAIANGGDVILANDIELTAQLTVNKDVTIDLNGHDLKAKMTESLDGVYDTVFRIENGAKMSIVGDGDVNIADGVGRWIRCVGAYGENPGGAMIDIYGGNWVQHSDDFNAASDPHYCEGIYANYQGIVNIYGGVFDFGTVPYYTLNESRGGQIYVYGGTFINFDPSKSAAGDGSYVAEGYKVVSETQANGDVWYTVVAE